MTGYQAPKTSTLAEVKEALMTSLARVQLDLHRHRGEHRTEDGLQDRVNQRVAERLKALEDRVFGA